MKIVDSHCHIDGEKFDADRDLVIERARKAGVAAMLNVGTGSPQDNSFERTVELAKNNPDIYAAVGIHPHDSSEYTAEVETRLRALTAEPKVVAWGEIGLDFHYDFSPRETQKDVFARQLTVARELDLPVIIHSRSANDETVEILTSECAREDFRGGVMHCFGGTPEMAVRLMKIGFFISFAGNVTFKKADELRDAAKVVRRDRLLVETDCPYLTPVPYRGKRNEPARVVDTARFLAEFYGTGLEELADSTTANFMRLFDIELPV